MHEVNKLSLYQNVRYFSFVWFTLWIIAFAAVFQSAFNVWWSNDTFNHCFFVLPIVAYFIWQQRGSLLNHSPAVSSVGGLFVLACILLILVGRASHTELFQHAAVFALLPSTLLFLLGWKVVREIGYPLLFVLFAIPIGEELVPYLQDITADIALYFLHLISLPVYSDGLYITIPGGRFVVAEACSGISFFIACLMMGTAYAYMNFVSRWRALAFVVFSIVLPVIANGIRVFGIIYIGHVSGMEHAVGADHLIYGGVFFALITIVLFVVGHFASDGNREWKNTIGEIDSAWFTYFNKQRLLLLCSPVVFAGIFLLIVDSQISGETFSEGAFKLGAVEEQEASSLEWSPRINSADYYFVKKDKVLNVYQAVFQKNKPGKELISSSSRLFDIDAWSLKKRHSTNFENIGEVSVLSLVSARGSTRLLAYWYVVPGLVTSNKYHTKLQQAINTLSFKPAGGALIAVSMSYNGAVEEGINALKKEVQENTTELSVELTM